jgi:hypothetical protein
MDVQRDNVRTRTPMRCPICGGALERVQTRLMGGITADIEWQMHAGQCPEHGWFQAEFTADPPREIFPVTRPFGTARRVVVDGREYFEFVTAWGSADIAQRHFHDVDALDPKWWATEPLTDLS